jgi:hypothetical protein
MELGENLREAPWCPKHPEYYLKQGKCPECERAYRVFEEKIATLERDLSTVIRGRNELQKRISDIWHVANVNPEAPVDAGDSLVIGAIDEVMSSRKQVAALEAENAALTKALEQIAGMGGSLAFAGDVARAALNPAKETT